MTSTIQYRLNLARALQSVSPGLSALHTSRAIALHPDISAVLRPSHCTKCGSYHFSGDHPSYLLGPSTGKKRKRAKSKHSKALQRRCYVCGFSTDPHTNPSVDHPSARVQPPSNLSKTGVVPVSSRVNEIGKEPPPSNVSRSTARAVQDAPSLPLLGRQPKSSALKDMLSRDRKREEGTKKRKEGREGLAAFLKEL